MSTRGIFGFIRNNVPCLFYNHSDSYPSGLGEEVVSFIEDNSIGNLNELITLLKIVYFVNMVIL